MIAHENEEEEKRGDIVSNETAAKGSKKLFLLNKTFLKPFKPCFKIKHLLKTLI